MRERKVVQWTLAYLAGAWAVLQVVDVLSNRFGWPPIIFRAITALLGVGFFAALIIAWYHGEQGRQRATGPELIMLACVLFVAGVAAALIGPERDESARAKQPHSVVATDRASTYRKYMNSPGYDAFMRGKVLLASENPDDTDRSIQLLEQAVAADPNLAPAYAELARGYRNKAFYFADDTARKQLNENAAVAVEKALTLDSQLADAHFARGLIIWTSDYRFPHAEAIASIRRALELNPDHDEAHHQLGLVYFHIGLLNEARSEIEKAVAINPGNNLARYRLGVIELYRGNYERAYAIFNSTPLNRNPSLWAFQMASVLLRLGRTPEANDLLTKFLADYPRDEGGTGHSVRAMIWAAAGDAARADSAIRIANQLGRGFGHFHHTTYNIASAHALLNRPDSAVAWLRVTADDGFPCYPYFANDANLNNIRGDARFGALMSKLKKEWEQYRAMVHE